MYQYGNPANDFYIRQAQQMAQQYQQPLQQFPQQQIQQSQQYLPQPQFITRFVGSIDEAKAAMVDALSTYIFIDQSTGRIYLKRLSNNGLSEFYIYEIADSNKESKSDPLNEINSRLSNIEQFIGEMKNAKSIPSNDESAAIPQPTITEPHEPNGATEPAGFSKNAGNGWRKK